jgi:hypothetical protein
MVFYHGKRFEAAAMGVRLVGVQCEKCGCNYFYELARIGTGSAVAPYGIGKSSASVSSQKQSQRDLKERLAHEAELVPCPKCNWINESLVNGYRLGRFRWFTTFAVYVGAVGTSSSLIGAWFVSKWSPADRVALPYFLFGGPVLFISLAVAIILLRKWLRSRIRPNRDFPLAPQLPPGTPPALVMDDERTEPRFAKVGNEEPRGNVAWHDFQLGLDQLPSTCCICLKDASPEHSYKLGITNAISLQIPRCADCAREAARRERRVASITGLVFVLAAVAVVFLGRLDAIQCTFLLIFGGIVALVVCSIIATSLSRPPVGVWMVDRSRGIIRLRFSRPDYRPVPRAIQRPVRMN